MGCPTVLIPREFCESINTRFDVTLTLAADCDVKLHPNSLYVSKEVVSIYTAGI